MLRLSTRQRIAVAATVAVAICDGSGLDRPLPWTPAVAVVSAQGSNLVVNGGFEAPVLPTGGYRVFSSIPGWAIPAGHPQFELQRRVAGDPFEGEQHCELDAFLPSTIFQDVPTSPGRTYDLSFAFSARPQRSAADNVLRVSWGGAVITTLVADGTGMSNTSWRVHRFQVTGGPGTTTRLTFEDLGAANTYGTYVDDVRVVEPSAGPPTASHDAFATSADLALVIAAPGVLANDSSNGGGAMTAVLVTGVNHGLLALSPTGGFTYTPSPGFSGTDSFVYRASTTQGVGGTAVVTLTVTAPSQNLLFNGSFEQGPSIPSGSSHTTVGAGSPAVPGWVVTGGTIDYFGPSWSLAHGVRGIDLDGAFSTGGIQQTVATVPGEVYVVSFALAGNVDGAPRVKRVRFAVDGVLHDLEFDTLGRTRAAPGWERTSFTFVASGTSATVSFTSLSRAGNSWGAMIDDVSLVRQPSDPQPGTDLVVRSIVGNVVTVQWSPPALGPAPTGYVLEGGRLPGEVLASIQTEGTEPVFAFAAPTGSFYIRIHTLAGGSRSWASNEVPLHVNVTVPPSAPGNLLGMVSGSSLALAWRNTFVGGPPSTIILDVTGAFTGSFTLGMADTFTFPAVPAGTYTLSVRASNAGGSGPPSNAVTLAFPGACSGPPSMPANVLAYALGRTIFVLWDPPETGSAPTGYVLNVTGAFAGSIPTTVRMLSGAVGPGSYGLRVQSTNPCGASPLTSEQIVSVP